MPRGVSHLDARGSESSLLRSFTYTPPLISRPCIYVIELSSGRLFTGMHQSVSRGRHLTASDRGRQLREKLLLLFEVVLAPAGQVHMSAGVVDVLLY